MYIVVKNKFSSLKLYQKVAGILATFILLAISVYYFNSANGTNVYNVDFSLIKQETVGDEVILSLRGISLPKGHYMLAVGLVAPGGGQFDAYLDNEVAIHDTLPVEESSEIISRTYNFDLKMGTDRGNFNFTSKADNPISLANIAIASDKRIYTDGIAWGILAILLIPCAWIALIFFDYSTHKRAICFVAAMVFVEIIPFVMSRGLNRAIDTGAHMMRIEGIYYGLLDGQFPVVVQPEWNNSYGQIGVLYPSMFLYIPAIFRCFGVSQLGVAKLYLITVVLTGGIISFAASRSIFKKDWQICVACLAILMDNMRIHNLFTGGKIGGSLLAELFWPLLVAGVIELYYGNRNKWYYIAIGLAGSFSSHVTSSTVACIFIVVFALFNIRKLKDKSIVHGIFKAIALFLGLTIGTIACFGKYYFTDWGREQLQWRDFVDTLWRFSNPFGDNRWTSVFLCMILCIAAMILILIREGKIVFKKQILDNYVIKLFVSATILLWMSTAYFPWVQLNKIPAIEYYTKMLQSGNRFLSLAGCAYAFCLPKLLSIVVYRKDRHSYESKAVVMTCVALFVMAVIGLYTEEKAFLRENVVKLYNDEVVGEMEYNNEDYLPAGTRTEWYTSDSGYISDENAVESLAYEREGTYVYYAYTNSKEGAYVEFPKFYYDGYIAEDEMADPVPVYKGDKNRVRVYLKMTQTPKIIRLWYYVPRFLTLACAISIGIWTMLLIILGYKIYKRI